MIDIGNQTIYLTLRNALPRRNKLPKEPQAKEAALNAICLYHFRNIFQCVFRRS
jgi:hypothetical protein